MALKRPGSSVKEVSQVAETPADDDGDEDALPTQGIRGGWSAAKQTMDATSDFAQAFKPEASIQIIKFLDDAPYAAFRRHWIDRNGPQGPTRRAYVCPQTVGKHCALCEVGDKVQGVSAFNVALIGDDGVPVLKTWDLGVKLLRVIEGYHKDPKVGPLTKGYFGVSKTGGEGRRSGGSVQTNVIPIKPTSLKEDYDITPPSAAEMALIGKYDVSVLEIPKRSELEEVAAELASNDDD